MNFFVNPLHKAGISGGSNGDDFAGFSASSTRRFVLQASAVFALAAIAGGCKRNAQALAGGTDAMPDVPWPEPPKVPAQSVPAGPTQVVTPGPVMQPTPSPGPVQPTFVPPRGSVVVIPRSQWTRSGIGRPGNINPLGGVTRITVHHEGSSKDFSTTDMAATRARLNEVRDAHMRRTSSRGERWADIGYHYIVDRAGRVWEGRPIQFQGAHVQDHNENNIGVMCLGNFQRQAPSREQLSAMDRFVAQLMKQYRVPLSRVYTHRELNATECPGRNLQSYMQQTRSRGGPMSLALLELDEGVLLA